MTSYFRRLLGAINIYQDAELIHIDGVYTNDLIRAFYEIWRTSKIGANIFTHIDSTSLTFNRFFVPDIIYSLNIMLEYKPKNVSIRMLEKIIKLLNEKTWFATTNKPVIPFLNRSKIKNLIYKPLEHQEKFLNTYENNVRRYNLKGFLLAAEPGAGKTYTGLLMGELLETDVNIFIVPANSIDLVWVKSFEELYVNKTSYWSSAGNIPIKPGYRNYVFHYENLNKAIEFAKEQKFNNALLWLDESHNLNDMSSIRTKLFLTLVDILKSNNVIWASGTPIKAMGKEVIPLLKSIDPYFDNDAENRFIDIFGKSSTRALDILSNRIGRLIHLTPKTEFRKDVPITKDIKISIPNGNEYSLVNVRKVIKQFIKERNEYYLENKNNYVNTYNDCLQIFEKTLKTDHDKKEFETYNSYINIIKDHYDPKIHVSIAAFCNKYEEKNILPTLPTALKEPFKNAKTIVKYVHLKVIGEALGGILGKMREQCVIDMVKYANLPDLIDSGEKKTLIFSSYINAIKEAERCLIKDGYKSLLVYGDTNKNLKSIINAFDNDEDINPLLATFASLSTAVPVTSANICINLNIPFREYIYKQAISRIDRIGQDAQVYIYNLYLDTGSEPNLSTRAGDILEWCREQVEQIIGKPLNIDIDKSVTLECFGNGDYLKFISPSNIVKKW